MDQPDGERILAIDDAKAVLGILGNMLTSEGYEVKGCISGERALTELSNFRPHIVLLDLRMPGMDGFTTMQKIHEIRPDIPVLVLTGVTDLTTAREAVEGGAADYITKPFDRDQLLTNISVHCLLSQTTKPIRHDISGANIAEHGSA